LQCSQCGQNNPDGFKFCGECGVALAVERVCPSCRTANADGVKFCGQCGTPLATAAAAAAPPARAGAPLPSSFAAGRYKVRAFLGEGAKKRVYLAHDTRLDRDVAFALIKTEGLDADSVVRIRREAQAMGRLGDHPHIVTVFDAGEEDNAPYIVSQHMSGGSVEDLLVRSDDHRLPSERAMQIAAQVAEALAHAHARGIIHRDLKPGNVWLDDGGNAALGDFGLAVAVDRSRMTMAGMMVGTVAYMAPEQALGRAPDARSDLYALGAMLYEMVTGRPPFLGNDAVGVISQHINTAPVAPTWHEPSVPSPLESLVLRLLAKSPEERPASAQDVANELRQILARSTVTTGPQRIGDDITDLRQLDWGRFVGRRDEIDQLRAALELTLSGKTTLAFIAGEPGIGKTRLAQEFAVYAELRGAQVLTGRSYEGEATVPYRPFVEALRQYVRAKPDGELRQQMGAGAPEIATMVSDVRQRFPDIQEAPKLEADAERLRLFDSITTFLRNASVAQPIVLLLDDLHWVDRPSLLLLQHVARHATNDRLLLLATYRDVELDRTHPLSEALAGFRRLERFTRVALRGLSQDDVEAMLTSIDTDEANALQRHALGQALYQETKGNPFFIREVLSHLIEERLIVRQGGRWVGRVSSVSDLGIPEGVRDVIARRLGRLTPDCRAMLTRASTMVRGFTWEALRAINPQSDEEALLSLLEEALAAQLVAPRREETPIVYDFTHPLIRHTLYDEISGPRRVLLHRQIGAALEALYRDNFDAHAGELAYHFYQAAPGGDVQKAVDFATRAGERAMALHGHEEAVGHFERAMQALELAQPVDERALARLLVLAGHALWHAGDFAQARDRYHRGARLARSVAAVDLLVEAAVGYGGNVASFAAGTVDQRLIEMLEAALAVLPDEDSEDRAILMATLAGALAFERSSQQRVRQLCDASLAMARRLARPNVIGRVLTYRHWALTIPGNARQRLEMAIEIVRVGEAAADLQLQLQGWLWASLDHVEVGEWHLAENAAARYHDLVETIRSPYYRWFGLVWDGMLALMQGRFDEGESLAQQALAAGQGTGNANALQVFAGQLAWIRLEQGRLAEIEPVIKGALAQNPDWAAWRAVLAMVYSETGRLDEARETVAELCRDRCAAIPRDFLFLITVGVVCIVLTEVQDAEAAAEVYGAAIDDADAFVVVPGLAAGPLASFLPVTTTVLGRFDESEALYAHAYESARRAGATYTLNWTRQYEARTLLRRDAPGDRTRALELIDLSLEAAQQHGWPRMTRRGLADKVKAQGLDPASISLYSSIDRVATAVTEERPAVWRDAVAPDGTVTIMFSDIEDSTVLTERLGDAKWQDLLRQHDALVRSSVEAHGGFVVKHLGDGFMVAFQSARSGVECAVAIQATFANEGVLPEPVRIRIGLHAGEAVRENDDFFGKNVVIASRVAGNAHGGEILVSSVLRALVESSLDPALFGPPRTVQLKGLEGEHTVYPLVPL
jgi:class 3 adenylate cyclase/tetratricopeptide (TPR) repeat protein